MFRKFFHLSRDPHNRILSDHKTVKKLNVHFELQKGIIEGLVANSIDLVGLRNTRRLMRHTFGCVCEVVFRQVYMKKEEKTHPEYEWLHPMGCGPGHIKNRKPMKCQYLYILICSCVKKPFSLAPTLPWWTLST